MPAPWIEPIAARFRSCSSTPIPRSTRARASAHLARPFRLYGLPQGESERDAVARLLKEVQLPVDFVRRYPHQLSGARSSASRSPGPSLQGRSS